MAGKIWIATAALLGAAAVALGAYHAHGLESSLAKRGLEAAEVAKQMHNCETAVRYQMFHALAMLGVGSLLLRGPSLMLSLAAGMMLAGVIGFSGGLLAMVFSIAKLHWSIVPLGGLLL
ncbi:MAG: DUF423 domain-containing protein, partial [Planctomycetales bacterium]|nr:DUF423 domain-containing protein [Planctomycetales bacterium]